MRVKKVIAGALAILLAVSMIPASVAQAAKKQSGHGFLIDGKLTDHFYSVVLKKGEALSWTDEESKTSVSSSCECVSKKRYIYSYNLGFSLKGDTSHITKTKADYNVFIGFDKDGKPIYEKTSALNSITAKDGPVRIYDDVTDGSGKYTRQVDIRCWGPNDKGVQYGKQCETYYYSVGTPYRVEYIGGNSFKAGIDLDGGTYNNGAATTATFDLNNIEKSIKNIEIPVKAGYSFDGWLIIGKEYGSCRLVSCENNAYTNSALDLNIYTWEFFKDLVKNGATIRAIWSKSTVNYTLDANGGVFRNVNDGKTVITTDNLNEIPIRYGYDFVDWYMGDIRIRSFSDIPVEKWNKEQKYSLTAKWAESQIQPEVGGNDGDKDVETPPEDTDVEIIEMPIGGVIDIEYWIDGADSEVVYSSDGGTAKDIEGISYDPSKKAVEIKNLPDGSNISINGSDININVEGQNSGKITVRGESDKSGVITFSGNGTLESSGIYVAGQGGNTQIKIDSDVTINVSDGGLVVEDTVNPNPIVIAEGTGLSDGELEVTSELRPDYDADGRIIVSKDGKSYCAMQYKSLGKIKIFEAGSWEELADKSIKWDGKVSVADALENAGYTIKRTGKRVYSATVSADAVTISSKYAKSEAAEKDTAKKAILSVRPLSKKTKAEVIFLREADANKYEIRYSTSKKMTGAKTKSVKIKGNDITATTKLTKLKAKKTYYIQVRKISIDDSGKQIVGAWSKSWKYKVE